MSNLIGSYECKVDANGRLPLPMGLKKQLESDLENGFVLKRSLFQPCLELYSMKEWHVVMQKINQINRFVKKNNDFIRRFTAGIKTIEIDSNGRVQIAKDLITFAHIDKEIVVSATVNMIEIWDKDLYENAINNNELNFADLAESVMGNI